MEVNKFMSDLGKNVGVAELKNDSDGLKSGWDEVRGVVAAGKNEQKIVDDAELNKFLMRVQADYVELKFRVGKKFTFRPPRTIILSRVLDDEANEGWRDYYKLQVLHEIGHALSGHKDYIADVERLKMEREAWEKARELAAAYDICYDEEFVEGVLDTYRDWLHQKSRCPQCGLTRCQTDEGEYFCVNCEGLGGWQNWGGKM